MPASASKSALLLSPCLRWAGPQGKEYRPDGVDTTKRDDGSLFHGCMDDYYQGKAFRACNRPEVGKLVAKAVAWSDEHLAPRCVTIHSEVYVAYNFATGEVHVDPSVTERGYPDKPGYLPGTTDLVCVLATDELLVADWKTGAGTGADKQLLTLACGLRKVYTMPDGSYRKVRLACLYANPDGIHSDEWPVTEGDLLAHEFAMAEQLANIGIKNEPVLGVHCTQLYCPHLAYCPGVTSIVEDLSQSPQALLRTEALVRKYPMTDNPISDEEAGHVMERITAARRQMKYYEECMRKYINNGGRAIAGDFEFKSTNSGFRWVKKT
jgi:hypothetical protein